MHIDTNINTMNMQMKTTQCHRCALASKWVTVSVIAFLGLFHTGCKTKEGGDRPTAHVVDQVARVTSGLTPALQVKGAAAVRYSLTERMKHYHTPGVSVAVVNGGRIEWAQGFGVTEAGTTNPITPVTLFEAGSISKPVAATATLRLVEQGKLNLDEPVNTYLKSWQLPDNEFTAKEKVTLRRIMSHSAGLTVHGFPGYAVTDSIPTLPQVLDGTKPANTKAVRVDTIPGSNWRYSGGGTTIQQLIDVDQTGKPFPVLLKELVFDPIGMANSTYEQPLPVARVGQASAAHRANGSMIPGRFHIYPEMAAAGLWTTPTDLLKWAMEIAAARAGKSNKVLSRTMATQMLTMQKAPVGLGPFLEGSGPAFRFGHGGSDAGFHSELVYFPETGKGAAVMVNSDGGQPMLREILYSIAAEYEWPEFAPRTIEAVPMDSTALDQVVGVYEVTKPDATTLAVTRRGARLYLEQDASGFPLEVVFTSPTEAVILDGGDVFTLTKDESGRVTALNFGSVKIPRKPGNNPASK
jgi:CubicO group peptidase (beta-lactamase class C family)